GANGCAARVGIRACEHDGTRANLLERTCATDGAANGQYSRPVEHEHAVVDGGAGPERARGAPVADLQRPSGDRRAAGVRVGARQRGRAEAGLPERAATADVAVEAEVVGAIE